MHLAALLLAAVTSLPRAGFLGVQVRTADGGVRVLSLVEGGSAKAAGIQTDDLITQVNDHKATTSEDFVAYVRTLHAGDVATVALKRGEQAMTLQMAVKPRPFEHAGDVDVTYDAVTTSNGRRRVIVTAPKADNNVRPPPAILYVNGIGCFSQESLDLSSADAKLLYGLTRRGFVTMRVEKTSMGDSEGPPCMSASADLQNEIDGYVAGLKALAKYPEVFIVGISIGGVEAPIIAKSGNVRGLVVINTVAKPFFEYLLDTRRRQMELQKMPFDEIDAAMRADEVCNHRFLIEKQTPDASCHDQTTYPAPATFMQQWAALNPAANWKAVDVPVLVVYGTADIVATQADSPLLAKIINSFHPGRASVRAMEAMDHTMLRDGKFDAEIVDVIGDWLAAHS